MSSLYVVTVVVVVLAAAAGGGGDGDRVPNFTRAQMERYVVSPRLATVRTRNVQDKLYSKCESVR